MPRKRHPGSGKGRALTLEQAPGFNVVERRRLKVIWDRIEFLEMRISAKRNSGADPGKDIGEVVAQRWVLDKAKMPIPPSAPNQNSQQIHGS